MLYGWEFMKDLKMLCSAVHYDKGYRDGILDLKLFCLCYLKPMQLFIFWQILKTVINYYN